MRKIGDSIFIEKKGAYDRYDKVTGTTLEDSIHLKIGSEYFRKIFTEPLLIRGTSAPTVGYFYAGDMVINTANNSIVGWKCVLSGVPGTWKEIGSQSSASANVAADVGATYSQSEVQAILTELRDLKTKMRTAGLLAT